MVNVRARRQSTHFLYIAKITPCAYDFLFFFFFFLLSPVFHIHTGRYKTIAVTPRPPARIRTHTRARDKMKNHHKTVAGLGKTDRRCRGQLYYFQWKIRRRANRPRSLLSHTTDKSELLITGLFIIYFANVFYSYAFFFFPDISDSERTARKRIGYAMTMWILFFFFFFFSPVCEQLFYRASRSDKYQICSVFSESIFHLVRYIEEVIFWNSS